jgi:hypothetical protein
MSTLKNESDIDLFRQIFGTFELYLPADFDVDNENHNVEIPADIQHLLALPFDDMFVETKSESETSTRTDTAIMDMGGANADFRTGETINPSAAEHTMPDQPFTDDLQVRATHPSNPTGLNNARFKALNDDELNEMRENKYSAKTKQNTKWGVNLFQGNHNTNYLNCCIVSN